VGSGDEVRAGDVRALRTPRSAAVAGLVFGVLLTLSLVLLWTSIPAAPASGSDGLEQQQGILRFAISLVPFAGIAFLWFLGVIRDRLGDLEDRFFATVLLGSGLLYLAMTFVAVGIAGGLLAFYDVAPSSASFEAVYVFSRSLTRTIVTSYAARMAGVFMMTLATMWIRTRSMPRWAGLGTYLLAAVLLFTVPRSLWAVLVFPGWVFAISATLLYLSFRSPGRQPIAAAGSGPPEP
jgi:hypothetical protein